MTVTDQRMSALRRANYVRLSICAVRNELGDGNLTFSDALRDPRAQRMTIETLVKSMPGIGSYKAKRILRAVNVTERRRVEELTHRQRFALVCMIEAETR